MANTGHVGDIRSFANAKQVVTHMNASQRLVIVLPLVILACTLLACRYTLPHSTDTVISYPVEVANDGSLSVSCRLKPLDGDGSQLAVIGFHNHSELPILLPLNFSVRHCGRQIVVHAGSRCNPAEPYVEDSLGRLGMWMRREPWRILEPHQSILLPEWIRSNDDAAVLAAWMKRSFRNISKKELRDTAEMMRLQDSVKNAMCYTCVQYLTFDEELREDGKMFELMFYDSVNTDSVYPPGQVHMFWGEPGSDSVIRQLPFYASERMIGGNVWSRFGDTPYMNIPDRVYARYVKYERILRKTQ